MKGKEGKEYKDKVWIKYSDDSGEKNLEQKVVFRYHQGKGLKPLVAVSREFEARKARS